MSFITNQNEVKLGNPLALFYCGWEKCKPSHSFGPAIRPHHLFHLILNGCGTYYVNGMSFHLQKGQGFLILPGETTIYTADHENPWEYCWIGFDGYDVKKILQRCGFVDGNLIYTDHSNGKLEKSLLDLGTAFKKGSENEYKILGQLYLCFSYMCTSIENVSDSQNKTHLEKALYYIHNNYTYDIRVSDIAKYVGIDRTYLYKLFVRHNNTSPLQYLIYYRLNIAKKMLIDTELSVTEIVYSCGFKDPPTFYKHFKKQLNMTPLQYRSNHFLV